MLDRALAELNESDREAILLRFFEGRDYASVGEQLDLAGNTARMRVERALDKLRAWLERRGVASTSAALAAALGHQAVVAAPVGLAAAVAGAVLAGGLGTTGVAATMGTAAAAAGFMSMTKLQVGVATALAVAGATGYVVQADSNARLRDDIVSLRQHNERIPDLERENVRLKRLANEAIELRSDDAEFVRLEEDAAVLRARLQQIAQAEAARAAASKRLAAEVFDISKLDQTPSPRFQARPQYPFEMRRSGINGEVVVAFVVDANGDVQNAFALRSSQREFEAAALQAVSKWKFQPGRKGGRDVATHLQAPIVFSIPNGAESGGMTILAQPSPAPAPATQPPFTVEGSQQRRTTNGCERRSPSRKTWPGCAPTGRRCTRSERKSRS